MRYWRVWLLLMCFAGLMFAVLVWPTPYRYERFAQTVVRISRVTGRADVLGTGGWEPLRR